MEVASVSAIIATKNRPSDLRLTLKTLLEQTVLPQEVVIIDQSADDKSVTLTREEFRQAGTKLLALPELKYVYDPSIVGVSAARNRGMQSARADIWLFLDDDVIMDRDFIQELLNVYSTNTHVDGVSGVITNYPFPPFFHRVWMRVFARGPFLEKRLPIYWHADELRNSGCIPVGGFSGGLMSFRSGVCRNGCFDSRLHDGEDIDFCLNLSGSPTLLITPQARLKHMSSPVGRSNTFWLEKFALSQASLYRKNWSHGVRNRICFIWLCFGLGLASSISALRRLSFKPLQAVIDGVRAGFRAVKN